jgi:hypothetical protein
MFLPDWSGNDATMKIIISGHPLAGGTPGGKAVNVNRLLLRCVPWLVLTKIVVQFWMVWFGRKSIGTTAAPQIARQDKIARMSMAAGLAICGAHVK